MPCGGGGREPLPPLRSAKRQLWEEVAGESQGSLLPGGSRNNGPGTELHQLTQLSHPAVSRGNIRPLSRWWLCSLSGRKGSEKTKPPGRHCPESAPAAVAGIPGKVHPCFSGPLSRVPACSAQGICFHVPPCPQPPAPPAWSAQGICFHVPRSLQPHLQCQVLGWSRPTCVI